MSEEQARVDAFVDRLREEPPTLDDVARARIERALVERRPVAVPEARSRAPIFLAGLAVGAVAAGVLVYALVGGEPGEVSPEHEPELATSAVPHEATGGREGPVAFETLRDGVEVGRGRIGEGDAVQTSADQLVRVRFGGDGDPDRTTSLVEVAPESRVRFPRASGDDLVVALERGSVRVEFHPQRRGEERLSVRTRDGRVEVVGTAFEVRLGPTGTEVRVEEGTVRLVGDGGPRLVSAGERAWLRRALGEERPPAPAAEASPASPASPEPSEPSGEVGETPAEPVEVAVPQAAPAGEPLNADLRFELADRLVGQGRFADARHELYAVTRSGRAPLARSQAWIRVAETFAREGERARAAEAYRRAARIGRGTPQGDAALFALGRELEESGDSSGARAAYESYLQVAPAGALASEAHRALCRLGERAHCE